MSATKQVSETSSPVTANSGEVVLYQPNEQVTIEVKMEYETVWLSQAQMMLLFDSTKQNFCGDFWEARELLEKLIKTATRRVVVIDQYIDATTSLCWMHVARE